MRDSMLSALFGAMNCEHRMAVIANNLANANTSGFKKEELAFKDMLTKFAHDIIMEPVLSINSKKLLPDPRTVSVTRISEAKTDFSQGALKNTENPLDVGLSGDGFMKVRSETGDFLTRSGRFIVNAEGQLVTPQGFAVLGDGGEITIPPNSEVRIDSQGRIYANEELVDQLSLVTAENLEALEKVGNNLFRLGQGAAGEIPAEEVVVNQGYLEDSNINVVEEMVNMIETQRSFEAYQKVIRSTEETDQKLITRVGKAT